jgi:hypothetical protein
VTEVALAACQVNVTLCPELMEFVLAEKVTVGEGLFGGGVLVLLPPQPIATKKIAVTMRETRRRGECSIF